MAGSVALGALLLMLGVSAQGCRSKPSTEKKADQRLNPDVELTDAPPVLGDTPGDGPSRCRRQVGARTAILTAEERGGQAAVEFSQAQSLASGYSLGILRSGERSEVGAVFLGTAGELEQVALGRVFGATEPPRVASRGDQAAIFVIADNDASNSTLRLARVAPGSGGMREVTWGPEAGRGRDQAEAFSLSVTPAGHGLLVWDQLDRRSSRGSVVGLSFDSATMKETSKARRLSELGMDVDSPLSVASGESHWLLVLSYEQKAGASQRDGLNRVASESSALVEVPPHRLLVARVSPSGASLGAPISVSEALTEALVFDATPLPGDRLLVAYRETQQGGPSGSVPVRLAVVSPSGSVERGVATSDEELGPGAPELLPAPGGAWLTLAGAGGRTLLARVQGTTAELVEEPGLFGRIPLAVAGSQLLAARPRALDVDLELYRCEL